MIGIIKKADIILGVIVAVLCGIVCWAVYGSDYGTGTLVTVRVDGEVYGTYDLAEDRIVNIDKDGNHNCIIIEGNKVLMTEADCPDKYCLGQYRREGGMDKSNQTIVCLPNRVVISISGGATGEEPDAVTGTRADAQM